MGTLTDMELIRGPSFADMCDIAMLVYDQHDPASFQYVASLCGGAHPRLGSIVVATKADLLALPQVW